MGFRPADGDGDVASFPSPASSTSSSDFEFNVPSLPKSSTCTAPNLCPADELFYKGKLLPLQLSRRISMVRSLLLESASVSSASDSVTTGSRDSNGSTSSSLSTGFESCDSSARPSSVTGDDDVAVVLRTPPPPGNRRVPKYLFSLPTRFSAVFLRRRNRYNSEKAGACTSKKPVKEVVEKYVKKVKPLYEKLSSTLPQNQAKRANLTSVVGDSRAGRSNRMNNFSFSIKKDTRKRSEDDVTYPAVYRSQPRSFSGNLLYASSKVLSESRSGVLCFDDDAGGGLASSRSTLSTMEELQSAIEGAIAHCKSSLQAARGGAAGRQIRAN